MDGEVMEMFVAALLLLNALMAVGHYIFDSTDKAIFYMLVAIFLKMSFL
jgi:hypothetical protein